MTNEEHAAIWRKGPAAYEEWKEANHNRRFDLSGVNLTGADLSVLDLDHTNLDGARLDGATISTYAFSQLTKHHQALLRRKDVSITESNPTVSREGIHRLRSPAKTRASTERQSETANREIESIKEALRRLEEKQSTYDVNAARSESAIAKLDRSVHQELNRISAEGQEIRQAINGHHSIIQTYTSEVELNTEGQRALANRIEHIESVATSLEKARTLTLALQRKLEEGVIKREAHDYIKVFGEAAVEDGKSSGRWLKASIAAGSILGGLIAIFAIFPIVASANNHTLASSILSRITAIGAISTVIVFCLRNYSAARHSQTLNLHRAHVMTAQEGFILSAGEEHKGEVIVETVKTAFSLTSTGFERSKEKSGGAPLMANIIKSVSGKGTPS